MGNLDSLTLKNENFEIRVDTINGGIMSLINPQDKFNLNKALRHLQPAIASKHIS